MSITEVFSFVALLVSGAGLLYTALNSSAKTTKEVGITGAKIDQIANIMSDVQGKIDGIIEKHEEIHAKISSIEQQVKTLFYRYDLMDKRVSDFTVMQKALEAIIDEQRKSSEGIQKLLEERKI